MGSWVGMAELEADDPPQSPIVAVVDETTPFLGGGIGYAVVSGILLGDVGEVQATMPAVIPAGRRRPFHWHLEGVAAKAAAVAALVDLDVVARAVVVPCGRRRQEAARAVALAATVEQLVDDGCQQLVIEARSPAQDGRDKATIFDVVRPRKAALDVSWERKSNQLLWIADAIGGAVHAHLTNGDGDDWFGQVVKATGLELDYRTLPPVSAPKKR